MGFSCGTFLGFGRYRFFGLWLWALLHLTIALHERTNIVQHFWTRAARKKREKYKQDQY